MVAVGGSGFGCAQGCWRMDPAGGWRLRGAGGGAQKRMEERRIIAMKLKGFAAAQSIGLRCSGGSVSGSLAATQPVRSQKTEIVILLGLARRTARKSEKVSLFHGRRS